MLAAVTALAALATDYPGTVHVDGFNLSAAVTVSQSGDNYTVTFGSFSQIGTVEITAPGTTTNGVTTIVTSQQIEGGLANAVIAFNQYALGARIDILTPQGTTKTLTFTQDGETTGYQIKNSGFENFKGNGEPFAWHGFASATGGLASNAPGSLGKNTDCHSGTYSALMTSGSKFGVVGNGTMTTGRLNAGSIFASNTANCSKMSISDTNTDANGDPFYTIIHGRPDAIKFWTKFTPKNNSYRASMSAIITDGSPYQDPEDKTYTNKLATAKDLDNIEMSAGWVEHTVDFNYINTNLTGRALLVTFSTSSTPGGGASGDALYVDDIALVYNAAITGITVKGEALEGFSQDVHEYNCEIAGKITDADIDATYVSPHAYLVKKAIKTDDGYKLIVAVVSNDFNTVKMYTINVTTPKVTLDGVSFTAERQWATWYGDQDLALPENVTASVVDAINGNNVSISSVEYLPANVGVLLHSTTAASEITTTPYSGTTQQVSSLLCGSTTEQAVNNGYLLYNNQFILAQDGATIAAHRCYLPIQSNVQNAPRMLTISNGTVTAIDELRTTGSDNAEYFDTSGRRVSSTARGILIVRHSDGTVTKVVR